MLVAFSVVGTLVLNTTYQTQYSMIEGTLLQLIKFIFKINLIKELDDINGGTGIAFGLIFLIFFNFILMPYFYSVIIVVYNSMREAMSITTEAITAIESDRQLEFMKKIYALVTFASPQAMQKQKKKEEEKKKKEKNKDQLSDSASFYKHNNQQNNGRTPDKKNKTIFGGSQLDNNSFIRSTLNSPVRGKGGGETPMSGDRTRQNMTMIQKRQSLRASQLFDTENNNNSFMRKSSRMQTMSQSRKQGQGYQSLEDRQLAEGAETKMKWKQKLLYNFKQLGLNVLYIKQINNKKLISLNLRTILKQIVFNLIYWVLINSK